MCGCNSNSKNGIGRKKMAQKKKSMKRKAGVRGFSGKDAGSILMKGALPGAAGAIILKMILGKILPAQYAQYSNYALAGAGVLAAIMVKNPMFQAAGLGAATVAFSAIGEDLVDGQVTGLGLLAPGVPSVRIAQRYNASNGVTTL